LNATARIHWTYRPGFKDPAKNPKTKLRQGPQMTEKQMNFKMRKLARKGKLKLLHPELRKRPMMMLRWAPRRGRAKPIRYDCKLTHVFFVQDINNLQRTNLLRGQDRMPHDNHPNLQQRFSAYVYTLFANRTHYLSPKGIAESLVMNEAQASGHARNWTQSD